MTKEVKKFGEVLKSKISIPIIYIDEALSSFEAESQLKENFNLTRKKRSKKIDTFSATIILKDYLNTLN